MTDDIPIFTSLISDLFPALDVPRMRSLQFEQMVKQSTLELYLQSEENFSLKVKEFMSLITLLKIFDQNNCQYVGCIRHEDYF